eukprot:Em0024g56a
MHREDRAVEGTYRHCVFTMTPSNQSPCRAYLKILETAQEYRRDFDVSAHSPLRCSRMLIVKRRAQSAFVLVLRTICVSGRHGEACEHQC